MTMDVYGDNEVNDLKELWETDLEVSAKKSKKQIKFHDACASVRCV